MATRSPLLPRHLEHQAHLQPYGDPARGLLVPMAFDHVELEYAAIRKAAGLMDLPQKGTIELTGSDRLELLNGLLTQDLRTVQPMHAARALLLNRKGRILADLRVLETGRRTLLAVDALVAQSTAQALEQYVFTEDVAIDHATERLHRLALHGPAATRALMAAADTDEHLDPAPGQAVEVMIAGASVFVEREDSTAGTGLELLMPAEHAPAVYEALAQAPSVRPIGWLAYNIARIEAGWPLFQIDFTTDNLPAETGVLEDRVSFTKGCYPGQEVVARMRSLGQPKQRLVALRPAPGAEHRLPEEGAPIHPDTPGPPVGPDANPDAGRADAQHPQHPQPPQSRPIGTVTSSTLSPMLGAEPIALAQLRTAHTQPGTVVRVQAEGQLVAFVVQPQLACWSPSGGAGSHADTGSSAGSGDGSSQTPSRQ